MITGFLQMSMNQSRIRLLALSLFLFMEVGVCSLQAQEDRKLRFSLSANPEVTWMKSDNSSVERDGVRIGVSYGLQADFYFLDNYALSTGLLINNSGGRLKYLDSNLPFVVDDTTLMFNTNPAVDPVSVTYKLQYVEIPLLLKMKTNEIGKMSFFGLFGLSAQMNIQAKGKANQLSIEDASFNDEVDFLNMGYQIGGGMEYRIGNNLSIQGGLSYFNGFSDVTTDTPGRKSDKTTVRSVNLHMAVIF